MLNQTLYSSRVLNWSAQFLKRTVYLSIRFVKRTQNSLLLLGKAMKIKKIINITTKDHSVYFT